MHPRNLVIVKLLLPCYISIAVVGVCQGQTGLGHATDSATNWKACKLAALDRQLKDEAVNGTSRDELEARRKWLKNWAVGSMTSNPNSDSQLPKFRTEPIMNSDVATKCRQRLNWESTEQDESDVLVLRHAIADRPNDIGLQQLHLHWLDLPVRRKTHLKQINASAIRLINSLKAQDVADPKIRLALEFTLYRRGRALAYRELPDVVKQIPIEDPKWLNKEVLSVYQEMIAAAGNGRPEFILLEIRILRRAKSFGSALSLLEKYGSAIKPQWYLKKRRDLLNELEWEVPYLEAAKIYENEYPGEVAKEKEGSQPAEPKKNSAGK